MITDIILTGFGICQVTNESADPDQESLTGYFLHSDTISFVDKTDTIPLTSGLRFGIEYLLKGTEEENAEVFDVRIVHPLLLNPDTDVSSTEVTETKVGYIGESNFDYFHIDHAWEMKPGTWLFQVIQSDRLLLEKGFDLYIEAV